MSEENIFGAINFDEGDDNPWGLPTGTHEVSISNAEIDRSSNGNLGLWLTFTNDEGKSIRKWTTMPEPDQDDVTRKRNTSFLRVLLNNLKIPKDKWSNLEPDDFVDLQCVITVKPQSNNPDYMQVGKITRVDEPTGGVNGLDAFSKQPATSGSTETGLAF